MSSAVLYLAIVAMWAVVLVPMWLRRDGDPGRPAISRLLHRRSGVPGEPDAAPVETTIPGAGPHADVVDDDVAQNVADGRPDRVRRRRNSRAAVIARRRRRTSGLALLLLASITTVIVGLAPSWVILPPAGLFAAHLSLLRVAAGMDVARRAEARAARAAERAEARAIRAARAAEAVEAAEAAAQAKVIDLMARNRARDVFDQYAPEGLRAVGD